MKIFNFLLLIILYIGIASDAYSQTQRPYLTAATFYISVDDWADMWLNDVPIVENVRRTGDDKSAFITTAVPESLCLFNVNNILAIEVDDSTRPSDPNNDYAGIAYTLQMDFSDGTRKILSSNEADQHLAYYVQSHWMGNPTGWQRFNFDDRSWRPAKNTGSSIPGLVILENPNLTGIFQFLSALSFSSKVKFVGEKHLFRRRFSLDISPNPDCDTHVNSPQVKPVVVSRPHSRLSTSPLPPTPTQDFRIEPMVVTQPDQRHPVTIPSPRPTATATSITPPLAQMEVTPTWTTLPSPFPRPSRKVKASRKNWVSPTWTPTIQFIQPMVAVPTEIPPISAVQVILPTWTPTFTVITHTSEGQTIVFDSPPANIYMSFADGPGFYRLEVIDKGGRHLRNLFEKNVVAQQDAWAEWDGKDDSGQDAPLGLYYVIFSKGGRELRKLMLLRDGTNK